MFVKTVVHIIFIVLIVILTFFGLGPVIFADGILRERMITLFVVLGLYFVVIWLYRRVIRGIK